MLQLASRFALRRQRRATAVVEFEVRLEVAQYWAEELLMTSPMSGGRRGGAHDGQSLALRRSNLAIPTA